MESVSVRIAVPFVFVVIAALAFAFQITISASIKVARRVANVRRWMIFVLAVVLVTATPDATAVPKGRPASGAAAKAAPKKPPAAKPTPSATATPVAARPTVSMRALAFYQQIRANAIDRTLLTPAFSSELTPDVATNLSRTLGALGEPGSFVERAKHDVGGVSTYDYAVPLAAGTVNVTIGIDDTSDAIARFYVRRAAGAAAR